MALKLFTRKFMKSESGGAWQKEDATHPSTPVRAKRAQDYEPENHPVLEEDPLGQLMQLGRFRIIRSQSEQWNGHPDIARVLRTADDVMDTTFALVPDGRRISYCRRQYRNPARREGGDHVSKPITRGPV